MHPIIKFRYHKARCPLCLADHGSRKQYESKMEILVHLNKNHSFDGVYGYLISDTPTIKGNYTFAIQGLCACGCRGGIRFDGYYMPDHGPPYYLSGHKSRLGPNAGTFEKGIIPWNKGTKGICKPNSGSFKKGNTPPNERGGLYTASNGQVLEWTGEYQPSGPRKYKPRSRRIMEEILGRALRDDEVVIHLDYNPSNDEPINLKVITRGENATRNRWRNYRAAKVKKLPRPKKLKKQKKVKKLSKPKVIVKPIKAKIISPPVESTKRPASPFCRKCGSLMPPNAPCPRC